ncbi:hypothetical protein GGH96_001917 [Coemansia sp. RSA 1972]|nr:hypothetical protein GGH96_001917 [Coemansia sp. RSA 1972]
MEELNAANADAAETVDTVDSESVIGSIDTEATGSIESDVDSLADGLGDAVTTADASAIRVLVVPVGRVRTHEFWAWTRALSYASRVGTVRLQFVTRADEHEHLEGLQTHRRILGIIGIVDGSCADISTSTKEFAMDANAHNTAVVHRCVGFDMEREVDGVVSVSDYDARGVAESLAVALKAALHVMAAALEEEEDSGRRGAELERGRMDAGGGRLQKLRGDVLLLAGRVPESLGAYAAACEASAATGDSLWQATAAEGYCAALVQMAAREPEAAGAYVAGMPGADVTGPDDSAGVAVGIAKLFERVPELLERCHAVAPVLYAEACARAAQAAQAAHVASIGGAERVLHALAQGRAIESPAHRGSRLVAVWAGRAWTSAQALTVSDQLRIAAACATVVGASGFARKANFYLRQFVLRSVPILMRSGRAAEAQTAFSDGSMAFAAVGAQAASAQVMFVPKRQVPESLKRAVVHCVDMLARGCTTQWMGLQLDVLRTCVAACAALPSASYAVVAATRLACCVQGALTSQSTRSLVDEQHVLRVFLQRMAMAAQSAQLGGVLRGLLVAVQHVTSGDVPRRVRAEHNEPSLFLHNPSAVVERERPIVVADERAWFVVTLRNPLPFALVLTNMALLSDETSGGSGIECSVPAGAEGRVLLPLTPHAQTDSLNIRGIRAVVFQHVPVVCELHEESAEELAKRARMRPLRQRLAREQRKLSGQGSGDSDQVLSPLDANCVLSVGVSPPMPLLSVVAASLCNSPLNVHSESPLSLYEGESQVIELVLANSGADADWLRVEFEPVGTQRDVVDAALEYQLDAQCVKAQGTQVLRVRVAGLPGLVGACVTVHYGTTQASEWARVVKWPLRVSVAPIIVPVQSTRYCDVPPYIVSALRAPVSDNDSDVVRILRNANTDGDKFCLAEISVANVGASDVRLEVEGATGGLTSVVRAGAEQSRVTVPLQRVTLDDREVQVPVPGTDVDGGPDEHILYPWRTFLESKDDSTWLRGTDTAKGRQFVVARTSGDAALRRTLYWTEHALAAQMRIRWTCSQSGRTGYVDIRNLLRVSASCLPVVRPQNVQMRVVVDSKEAQRTGHMLLAQCRVRHSAFVEICVLNNTGQEIKPVASVQVEGRQTERVPQMVDAWAYEPVHVERLASACVRVPSVKGRLSSRFRFKPATKVQPATDVAKSEDVEPQEECALVFDDISQLVLDPIAANSSRTLKLPIYVATPSRHQIDISITTPSHVVQSTLIVT